MYCQLMRTQIRDEAQDASLSDRTKILGQRWKSLGAEEKKIYYDMYEKDKERYEREMAAYHRPGTEELNRDFESDLSLSPSSDDDQAR